MGFHAGNYTIPGLIAEIVAELDATADWTIHDSDVPGGWCLRYVPDDTYMTIQARADKRVGYVSSAYYWTGIAVRFSSGFDTGTHEPTGTISNGMIPICWSSNATGYGWQPALLDTDHSYPVTYWIDKYGFIGTIQNPYRTDSYDVGAFFALECIPTAKREFSDGYRAPCFHVRMSWGLIYDNQGYVDNQDYYWLNVRPFATKCSGTLVNWLSQTEAYRSQGNSKIYFEFPYFHNLTTDNNPDNQREFLTPIYQTRRWFAVSPLGGLAANDVVSWLDPDGVTVRKFIITEFKGENDPNLLVAIPYEHAYEY